MTANFQSRLAQSARLEKPFIAASDEVCRTQSLVRDAIASASTGLLQDIDDEVAAYLCGVYTGSTLC